MGFLCRNEVRVLQLRNWAIGPQKKSLQDSNVAEEDLVHVASSSGDIIGPRRSDQQRNCVKLRMDELSAAAAADLKTFGLNGGSDLLLSPS